MSTDPDLPVRYCHGCRAYDDHPRFLHIADAGQPADDLLYHYDCIPVDVRTSHGVDDSHPAIAATSKGKRGDEIRTVMTKHAASLVEAPADTQEG